MFDLDAWEKLDVSWNALFKTHVTDEYVKWFSSASDKQTKFGNMKASPRRNNVKCFGFME